MLWLYHNQAGCAVYRRYWPSYLLVVKMRYTSVLDQVANGWSQYIRWIGQCVRVATFTTGGKDILSVWMSDLTSLVTQLWNPRGIAGQTMLLSSCKTWFSHLRNCALVLISMWLVSYGTPGGWQRKVIVDMDQGCTPSSCASSWMCAVKHVLGLHSEMS